MEGRTLKEQMPFASQHRMSEAALNHLQPSLCAAERIQQARRPSRTKSNRFILEAKEEEEEDLNHRKTPTPWRDSPSWRDSPRSILTMSPCSRADAIPGFKGRRRQPGL